MGQVFRRYCREDISAPGPVIAKANAEHAPVAVSIGRVEYQVGRPRQPQTCPIRLPDQRKVRLVLRFPGQTLLQPADYGRELPAVAALIDATLIYAGVRRRARFPAILAERKNESDGDYKRHSNDGSEC